MDVPRPQAPGGVFLVGTPRSGTTLLQGLLATQPGVTSFTESHFFDRHYRRPSRVRRFVYLRCSPEPRVRQFLVENGMDPAPAARFRTARMRSPFMTRRLARRFLEMLDAIADARRARLWVEKTPGHLQYMEFLSTLRADLRFVHIVRTGPANILSLQRASRTWQRAYGLAECIDRWNEGVRLSRDRVDHERHLVILYEDLVADPEASMRAVCRFLGLAFDPDGLDHHTEVARSLVRPDENWKSGVFQHVGAATLQRPAIDSSLAAQINAHITRELYDDLACRARGRVACINATSS